LTPTNSSTLSLHDALPISAEPNPFPSICGRVCTAPCEDVCRRGEFDEPIAIRDLKRFATDHGAPAQRKITPPKHKYVERVAIVRSEEHTSELQSPDHLVCR